MSWNFCGHQTGYPTLSVPRNTQFLCKNYSVSPHKSTLQVRYIPGIGRGNFAVLAFFYRRECTLSPHPHPLQHMYLLANLNSQQFENIKVLRNIFIICRSMYLMEKRFSSFPNPCRLSAAQRYYRRFGVPFQRVFLCCLAWSFHPHDQPSQNMMSAHLDGRLIAAGGNTCEAKPHRSQPAGLLWRPLWKHEDRETGSMAGDTASLPSPLPKQRFATHIIANARSTTSVLWTIGINYSISTTFYLTNKE